MTTPGSRARSAGLTIMALSVGAGVPFGIGASGFALLLCFIGLLAGVSLVVVGVRTAGDPAARVGPAVFLFGGARHLHVVGLVIASSAVTAVSGEAGPALCFGVFALFLLGLSLISVGARGE